MECYDDYSKNLLTSSIYDLDGFAAGAPAEEQQNLCDDIDFDDNETQTTQTTTATSTTQFSVSLVEFSNNGETNTGAWNRSNCKPSAIKAEQQRQQQELQQLQQDGIIDDVNEYDAVLNHTRRHHMIGQQEWLAIRGDRRIISEEEARKLRLQFENSERLLTAGGPRTRPRILCKLDGKTGKHGKYKCRMASLADIKKNVNTKRPTPKAQKNGSNELNKSAHSATKKRKVAPMPAVSSNTTGKGKKVTAATTQQRLPRGQNATLRVILSSYFEKLNELEQEHYKSYYQTTNATTQSLASRHAQDFRKTLDAFLSVPYTDQLPDTLLEFAFQGYQHIIQTTMSLWDELCKLFKPATGVASKPKSQLTVPKGSAFDPANDDDMTMDDDSNIDICIDGIICSIEGDDGSRASVEPMAPVVSSIGKTAASLVKSPALKTPPVFAFGQGKKPSTSQLAAARRRLKKRARTSDQQNDFEYDKPKTTPLRVSWIAENHEQEDGSVSNPFASPGGTLTGAGTSFASPRVPISEMERLRLQGDGSAATDTGKERNVTRKRNSFEQNPVDNGNSPGRTAPESRGIMKSHSTTDIPCNPSPSVGFRAATAYKISVALQNKRNSATPKALKNSVAEATGTGSEAGQVHPDTGSPAPRLSVASRNHLKSPPGVDNGRGTEIQMEESMASPRKSAPGHSFLPPPPPFSKSAPGTGN